MYKSLRNQGLFIALISAGAVHADTGSSSGTMPPPSAPSAIACYWKNKRKEELSKKPVAIPYSVILACIDAQVEELRRRYAAPMSAEVHITGDKLEMRIKLYQIDMVDLFRGLSDDSGMVHTSEWQVQDVLDEHKKVLEKELVAAYHAAVRDVQRAKRKQKLLENPGSRWNRFRISIGYY